MRGYGGLIMGKFWYKIRINANLDYYVFCTPDDMTSLLALMNKGVEPKYARKAGIIRRTWIDQGIRRADDPTAMLDHSGARTLDWLMDHYK